MQLGDMEIRQSPTTCHECQGEIPQGQAAVCVGGPVHERCAMVGVWRLGVKGSLADASGYMTEPVGSSPRYGKAVGDESVQ